MSDDLVKRLRDSTSWYHADCELKMKCADRIEELEAELAKPMEARMGRWDELLEPAREALEALFAEGDAMADRIEELEAELAKLAKEDRQ